MCRWALETKKDRLVAPTPSPIQRGNVYLPVFTDFRLPLLSLVQKNTAKFAGFGPSRFMQLERLTCPCLASSQDIRFLTGPSWRSGWLLSSEVIPMASQTCFAGNALTTHRTAFLNIMPKIEMHARFAFRLVRCTHDRADAVAEVVALCWMWFCRLAKRGKDPTAFSTTLASFASRQVKCGRSVRGQENSKDALSATAQRCRGFQVRPLVDATWTSTSPSTKRSPTTRGRPFPIRWPFVKISHHGLLRSASGSGASLTTFARTPYVGSGQQIRHLAGTDQSAPPRVQNAAGPSSATRRRKPRLRQPDDLFFRWRPCADRPDSP